MIGLVIGLGAAAAAIGFSASALARSLFRVLVGNLWTAPIAAAVWLQATASLSLAPLVAVVATAALVEQVRPGGGDCSSPRRCPNSGAPAEAGADHRGERE